MKAALVVVDVQKNFFSGGALSVADGDEIIKPLNKLIAHARSRDMPLAFTRDWHPENHCSFQAQGGPWPPHCVQGTDGAAFHGDLKVPSDATIFSKGDSPDAAACSGFMGTRLAEWLTERKIESVVLGGLTTDYSLKESAFDALENGFRVTVISNAIAAVNTEPDDGTKAIHEMMLRGARFLTLDQYLVE